MDGNNKIKLWKDGEGGGVCTTSYGKFPVDSSSNGFDRPVSFTISPYTTNLSPGSKFKLVGYLNPNMTAKAWITKEILVRSLTGGFAAATPDKYTQGKVAISGVWKGTGANGNVKIWSSKDRWVGEGAGETIDLTGLTPGEHVLDAYMYHGDAYETKAAQASTTVRVLGGTFASAVVENGILRMTGEVAGGADQIRIYRGLNASTVVKVMAATGGFNLVVDDLPLGTHTLYAYAYRGTQFLSLGSKEVKITEPPVVNLTAPPPNSWHNGTQIKVGGQVTATANLKNVGIVQRRANLATEQYGNSLPLCDTESGCGLAQEYTVDDVIYKTTFWKQDIEVALRATDVNNDQVYSTNDRSATGTGLLIKYDGVAPAVTWPSGAEAMASRAAPGKPYHIKVDVRDEQSGVNPLNVIWRWRIGTSNWSEGAAMIAGASDRYTAQLNVPSTASEGDEILFQVRATDNIGNATAYSNTNQHVVSVTKPVLTLVAANGWHNGGKIKLSGTAKSGVNIKDVGIGWRKSAATGTIAWYGLCRTEQSCGATTDYSFGPIDSPFNVSVDDVELFFWARDTNETIVYFTDNGTGSGRGVTVKHDGDAPIIVWPVGAEATANRAAPGKPFEVKVDVSDAQSGVDPANVKLRWKIGANAWSGDLAMSHVAENRYSLQVNIPADVNKNDPLIFQVQAADTVGNIVAYANNNQHVAAISKPEITFSVLGKGGWHNGSKIKVSGKITSGAAIKSVAIGQRKTSEPNGIYRYWNYVCKGNCGLTSEYNLDQVEYVYGLYTEDVEIAIWAEDVLGGVAFSTLDGNDATAGFSLKYDGKAPVIHDVIAKWDPDGSLIVSGSFSDDASGLGAGGDGKAAIVLGWSGMADQLTLDVVGDGLGSSATFSHTFAKGDLPAKPGVILTVAASDRAGNVSLPTAIEVGAQIPKLALRVEQIATSPPRQAWFAGESVAYRLTLAVATDSVCAMNSDVIYALPAQLQLDPGAIPLLTVSDGTVIANLDSIWTGESGFDSLLSAGGKLCAGQSLHIDVPLIIAANASGETAVSVINATADNLIVALLQKDSITVMPDQGSLQFTKTVDKDSAEPGNDLTYTIIFKNRSDQYLTMREIEDVVAPHTLLQGLPECGAMPPGLMCNYVPTVPRGLQWSFSGELAPGESGQVSYKVRIQ
ncbi:DUF11 domain-containing protein [Glaciimonas sp. PCH181]|uniref:DUF11 domain-containing protein n=1 Tax=Glaciimonas sp. PCH181 TaxID=2133943 RepID=UPI0013750F19|nr:DUF11 domain-containing protein [Glaciimonas sp. PCH181]